MKKSLLIILICSVSVSIGVSCNSDVGTTQKLYTIDDLPSYDVSDLIIKATPVVSYDNVATYEPFLVVFGNTNTATPYKMGALKNKVNNIHLFFRQKDC